MSKEKIWKSAPRAQGMKDRACVLRQLHNRGRRIRRIGVAIRLAEEKGDLPPISVKALVNRAEDLPAEVKGLEAPWEKPFEPKPQGPRQEAGPS